MPDALLAYITWDRLVPWKILSLPDRVTGDFIPIGYGSKQPVFRKRALKDSLLWVITMPRPEASGDQAPPYAPSLVARIKVKRLCSIDECPDDLRSPGIDRLLDQWGWVAVSDPQDSRFFELNDASQALEGLGLLGHAAPAGRYGQPAAASRAAQTASANRLRQELGKRLRFITWLPGGLARSDDAFRPCMDQAKDRTVFISFTHAGGYGGANGERFALDLAQELVPRGFSPWLDALAIPRYDLAREDDCSPRRLEKLIDLGITRSQLAIALMTDDYAQRTDRCGMNWTQTELEQILARRRHGGLFRCVQVMRGGAQREGFDHAFGPASAREVACAVAEWWYARGSTDLPGTRKHVG
jgi:hypothetical protein